MLIVFVRSTSFPASCDRCSLVKSLVGVLGVNDDITLYLVSLLKSILCYFFGDDLPLP